MSKFVIAWTFSEDWTSVVEADTAEEARQLFNGGDADDYEGAKRVDAYVFDSTVSVTRVKEPCPDCGDEECRASGCPLASYLDDAEPARPTSAGGSPPSSPVALEGEDGERDA